VPSDSGASNKLLDARRITSPHMKVVCFRARVNAAVRRLHFCPDGVKISTGENYANYC